MLQRDRYLDLMRAQPELFANPPGAAVTIVLDEAEIREIEAAVADRLEAKGLPREWAQVGIVYEDQYACLLRDAVRFPNGVPGTYIRFVDEGDSVPGVVVLPCRENRILLLRHFRHATRTWHWELPRGFGAPGHTGEKNARRELEEETGATIVSIVPLGAMHPDAGAGRDFVELFYAGVESYGPPETLEGISELKEVTLSEFERMIRDEEITDGFTLAAYARAKARGFFSRPSLPGSMVW